MPYDGVCNDTTPRQNLDDIKVLMAAKTTAVTTLACDGAPRSQHHQRDCCWRSRDQEHCILNNHYRSFVSPLDMSQKLGKEQKPLLYVGTLQVHSEGMANFKNRISLYHADEVYDPAYEIIAGK